MDFSVLMSVYSNEVPAYLDAAFDSIWFSQTQKPSEIVLVKDGVLTSELEEVIKKWKDQLGEVLKLISLESNCGLATALNTGLKHCKNEIVMRMDSDDQSLPDRFFCQYSYMQSNPDVDVVGTQVAEYNADFSQFMGVRKVPIRHDEIYLVGKLRNPISHPSVCFRKKSVLAVGGYPPFRKSQDYALWSLMLQKGFIFANLDKVLVNMRQGESFMKRRGWVYFKAEVTVLCFIRKIGYIGKLDFYKSVVLRFILRITPLSMKKLMYKVQRNY